MNPISDRPNDEATTEPSALPTVLDKALDETSAFRVKLELPTTTIIKVFAAILIALAAIKLWSFMLLVFLALFLAVTLHPIVEWLESKNIKHGASLMLVIVPFLLVIGFGIALIIPALFEQLGAFSKSLPALREGLLTKFPPNTFIGENLNRLFDSSAITDASAGLGHLLSIGGLALSGLSDILIVLVIGMYLLVDGPMTFEWVLAFFTPLKRAKMRNTAEEMSQVIFGYVAGQALTSALVTIYAYIVLSLLHVPGALVVSILAGVFDVLPIIGFFLAAAPACMLALTVSPSTAFLVLVLYLVYHLFEAYLLVPKVYGKSLRLSTLSVLLGLLAGGILAGIPGALAVLPVIASYAVIERIWLKPFLGKGVSEKHELQSDEEFGEKA